MNRKAALALLLCGVGLFFSACGATVPAAPVAVGDGRMQVITSFYAMRDFAEKIGGDKIDCRTLVPAGVEPHDWEPSPGDRAALQKADVFLYNGAGMEAFTDALLPALPRDQPLVMKASRGISLIGPSASSDARGGAGSDPHVWLNPENAKIEMRNICDAFNQKDPRDKPYFEANYAKYASQLEALDEEYQTVLSACPKKDIVVAHQAFGYLCERYGLNQTAIEGVQADGDPPPAKLARIIQFVRQQGIKTIFYEELVSSDLAQSVAKQTGAMAVALSPIEGLSAAEEKAGDDYFSLMRKNLDALKAALQ